MIVITLFNVLLVGCSNTSNTIDTSNKSFRRTISYEKESEIQRKKVFHFSIDDVTECLKDVNQNGYSSIFQNKLFDWLRYLHNTYGIVVSCYVFYKDGDFSLDECTDKYREEFVK